MKRSWIIYAAVAVIGLLLALKFLPLTDWLWQLSQGGAWLLPLVIVAALLDSIHPCSFSILLITIAFLFALQLPRRRILAIGGIYVLGIFVAYFGIGLGILQALHLFNTPHFMGKVGAAMLIIFGVINLANYFFPNFPIKLKLPNRAHETIGKLMHRASIPAALGLGILVGLCQFPCMGGPYLMVIGLLRDQATYLSGVAHLLLYNLLLIVPLLTVLVVAAEPAILGRIESWKKRELSSARLWVGLVMLGLGLLILFV